MRSFVSPIGYNQTSVVRPVLSHGLDPGDHIELLRPADDSDDRRAEEAITDVERFVTEIDPDVSTSVTRIPHDDFESALRQCGDLLRALEGDVVVNLGGGARDILVPLTTATLVHHELIATTLSFSDVDGAVREIDLPRITASIPDTERPTLEAIAEHDGTVSIPTLTDETDRSKSSVTRHVARLEDAGLVRTDTDGKTKVVAITTTGRLLLAAASADQE